MIQRLLPFLTLTVLFVGLAIASPHFLTSTNLSSVVRQTAVINIMALGMTLIIISGGIDLSVGAILAMGGLLGCMAMEKGQPIAVGVLVGVLAGAFWGFVNGTLTTKLRINPFIVTLGTLGIVRGLTLIISNGLPSTRFRASSRSWEKAPYSVCRLFYGSSCFARCLCTFCWSTRNSGATRSLSAAIPTRHSMQASRSHSISPRFMRSAACSPDLLG
jgi:ribose/xylose/arabinose/galactoside ABC-type transport system permease subunit